jgi:hypothetical protein
MASDISWGCPVVAAEVDDSADGTIGSAADLDDVHPKQTTQNAAIASA